MTEKIELMAEEMAELDEIIRLEFAKALAENGPLDEKLPLPHLIMMDQIMSHPIVRIGGGHSRQEQLEILLGIIDQIVTGSDLRVLMLMTEIIEMSLPGFAKNGASLAAIQIMQGRPQAVRKIRHKLINLVEVMVAEVRRILEEEGK